MDDLYGSNEGLFAGFVRNVDPSGRCDFTPCSGQIGGRNSLPKVIDAVASRWPIRADGGWALVLLDVQFSQEPAEHGDSRWGFTVLRALRERWPDLPIVMLTSQAGARSAANGADADGFFPKPSARDSAAPQDFLRRLYSFGLFPDLRAGARLAGTSLPMLRLLQEARQFACDPLGSGRILYGETGTGKTELARFIHDEMRLLVGRTGEFHSWSTAVADEDITKAALFGHWRGAATGATADSQPGEIEKSHGGTFFLDEVASLTPGAQALFIETRRRDSQLRRLISRMGTFPSNPGDARQARASVMPGASLCEDRRIAVDVVMLTASNLNLHDEEVADALGFRRDLLNDLGAPIYLPALNERREDIPEIFEHIVGQIGAHLGRPLKRVNERVVAELKDRDWTKRNIVGLRQIAEHAVIASRDFDEILVRHLPPPAELRRWAGDRPKIVEDPVVPSRAAGPGGSVLPRPTSVVELAGLIDAFEAPIDAPSLNGALPILQRAYARLVLRLLGATLRATRSRLGVTQSTPAVRHLLGLNPVQRSGAADKPVKRRIDRTSFALGAIGRISDLCDVYFGAGDDPVELLSDDVDVVERVNEARLGRGRGPLAVPDATTGEPTE